MTKSLFNKSVELTSIFEYDVYENSVEELVEIIQKNEISKLKQKPGYESSVFTMRRLSSSEYFELLARRTELEKQGDLLALQKFNLEIFEKAFEAVKITYDNKTQTVKRVELEDSIIDSLLNAYDMLVLSNIGYQLFVASTLGSKKNILN